MNNSKFIYHQKLTDHFKEQKKTWDWFANKGVQQEQIADYRKELLKNTYRLSPDTESKVYDSVELAKEKLNIKKNVTVYQELDSVHNNARVSIFENDIDIVFSGRLMNQLSEKELLAVISHELSHVLFYNLEDGDYETTSRIIYSIANDPYSNRELIETARLFQLYVELFCDRGALHVVEDLDVVVETLVKVSTGLQEVSAKNYLKQAREIFEKEETSTLRTSHPETYIRSRALEVYQNKEDEDIIHKIIDAKWGMNRMDIFKQAELHDASKKIIQLMTKPKWIRTDRVATHCKAYFNSYQYSDNVLVDDSLETIIQNTDDTIIEYFSYLLMDFAMIDPSLEKAPLGHAFQIAEALGFEKTFRQILKKELKLTVKNLNKLVSQGVSEVSQLAESQDESILRDQ